MKINWIGSFSQGMGYSGASENTAIALERAGADIRLMTFMKGNEANITAEGSRIRKKPYELAEVGIVFGLPNAFSSLQNNKIKIGYTMWETDKFPSGANYWAGPTGNAINEINKLDALIVPCQHNKDLFLSAGAKVPIHVVHLGVDTKFYHPIERPARKPFTFLQLGLLTIRKNPGYVVAAFLSLFKDNPDVKLVLKTHAGTLGQFKFPYKNIEIIDRLSTMEENRQFFYDADCFVWPSRGEGFGLPPLEAMATGMPAIVAKNTGMLEYANSPLVYGIKEGGKQKAIRFPKEWGDVGNWYESDFDDLMAKMQYVYDHQEEARNKGILAAKWVNDEFTFNQTAKGVLKVVDNLLIKR